MEHSPSSPIAEALHRVQGLADRVSGSEREFTSIVQALIAVRTETEREIELARQRLKEHEEAFSVVRTEQLVEWKKTLNDIDDQVDTVLRAVESQAEEQRLRQERIGIASLDDFAGKITAVQKLLKDEEYTVSVRAEAWQELMASIQKEMADERASIPAAIQSLTNDFQHELTTEMKALVAGIIKGMEVYSQQVAQRLLRLSEENTRLKDDLASSAALTGSIFSGLSAELASLRAELAEVRIPWWQRLQRATGRGRNVVVGEN